MNKWIKDALKCAAIGIIGGILTVFIIYAIKDKSYSFGDKQDFIDTVGNVNRKPVTCPPIANPKPIKYAYRRDWDLILYTYDDQFVNIELDSLEGPRTFKHNGQKYSLVFYRVPMSYDSCREYIRFKMHTIRVDDPKNPTILDIEYFNRRFE